MRSYFCCDTFLTNYRKNTENLPVTRNQQVFLAFSKWQLPKSILVVFTLSICAIIHSKIPLPNDHINLIYTENTESCLLLLNGIEKASLVEAFLYDVQGDNLTASVIVKLIASYIDSADLFELSYKTEDMFDGFDIESVQSPIDCYLNTVIGLKYGGKYTGISRNSGGHGPCVFGTELIQSGVSIWRFRIRSGNHWYIGIIDASLVQKMNNFYKTIKESYSLYGYRGNAWHNGEIKETNFNWTFNAVYDPEVVMCFDFNSRKLFYSINGKPFQCVFDNIDTSKAYKLAVCIYGPKHNMQLIASKYMK